MHLFSSDASVTPDERQVHGAGGLSQTNAGAEDSLQHLILGAQSDASLKLLEASVKKKNHLWSS